MKKIITLLLLTCFFGGSFSWADSKAACAARGGYAINKPDGTFIRCTIPSNMPDCVADPSVCTDGKSCNPATQECVSTASCAGADKDTCKSALLSPTCDWVDGGCFLKNSLNPLAQAISLCTAQGGIYNTTDPANPKCEGGDGLEADQTVMGMKIGPRCLLQGQCTFNVYSALGIKQSVSNPSSVGIFVQDIVLSATMFIGTIVTLAIIISGLMRIFAGATGKDPTKAKSGLVNAFIGLLLVVSSYLIIRLVQYIAKGV